MFQNITITRIHVWGMLVMLLFVVLFLGLMIHEEYHAFDEEAMQLRKNYIGQQKETIKFDTNRVLEFINHAYTHRQGLIGESVLKAQIIETIEQLYGRQDGTGYIFIYSFGGIKLSDPIQKNDIGKNLYAFKDRNDVQVIKELIGISQKKGGGFVQYLWMKPTTGVESPKISYANSFKPWEWMVGTGVYLDEVEKVISGKKEALRKRLIKYVMEIFTLAVILFGIGFLLVALISYIIHKEITSFDLFFKKASKNYTVINKEEIHLNEFKELATYVNHMVLEIHKRKEKLKEMNLRLEKNVEQKTIDLNRKNKLLKEEKRYSESLVKAQDSFIRNSIHEINTPLAVIMTHIDIYKMKYGENAYLDKIEAASKMITTIYDDLSYMVKKDRLNYSKSHINLSLFLEERILFFEEIASGNHHKIIPVISEEVKIFFNDLELQRVIDNNLSNAIKYAKKNTAITVELIKTENDAVLKFLTHSKKIIDAQRIFEPFHREESEVSGFGLGLEIVSGICNREKVQMHVESDENITVFSYTFRMGVGN